LIYTLKFAQEEKVALKKSYKVCVKNMKIKILATVSLLLFLASVSYSVTSPSHVSAKANLVKNSVSIGWSAVSESGGYNVYRKASGKKDYIKLNKAPVNKLSFEDDKVARGNDYEYIVKPVGPDGVEGAGSTAVGAPLMEVSSKAEITTLRDKPLTARSIKTGRIKTFAAPGDIVTYSISYKNMGYSSAKNVSIKYAIPVGTVIAGRPMVTEGRQPEISYFDKEQKKWVKKIDRAENISHVQFDIPGEVQPAKSRQDVGGSINLNVVIGL